MQNLRQLEKLNPYCRDSREEIEKTALPRMKPP